MKKISFRFSGVCSDMELRQFELSTEKVIGILNDTRSDFQKIIQNELKEIAPEIKEVDVNINFREGSVEWVGEVVIWLDWMARLGGAAAFVLLLRDATKHTIDRLLTHRGIPHPRTTVRIVYPRNVALLPYQRASAFPFGMGVLSALTALNTLLLLLFVIGCFDVPRSAIDIALFILAIYGIVVVSLFPFWYWRR